MPTLHLQPVPPRTTKGEILRLLCDAGGIDGKSVGRIDLRGTLAAAEVPAAWVARLVEAVDGAALNGRNLRAWSAGDDAPAAGEEDHFQRLSRLLEMEAGAEADVTLESVRRLSAAEAERTGECLAGLVIVEEDAGLGGRSIVTLARRNRQVPLPWNRLEPGAPVLLVREGEAGDEGQRGVVFERAEKALRVALAEPPD